MAGYTYLIIVLSLLAIAIYFGLNTTRIIHITTLVAILVKKSKI